MNMVWGGGVLQDTVCHSHRNPVASLPPPDSSCGVATLHLSSLIDALLQEFKVAVLCPVNLLR